MSMNDVLGSVVRELVGVPNPRDLATILRTIQNAKKVPGGFAKLQDFTKTLAATAVAGGFITATHFVTSEKLYVCPGFTQLITANYTEPLVKRGLEGIEKAFDLARNMSDTEIIAELGGEEEMRKYAFTPDQVADMIDIQPGGSPGAMLTNGYANIFYMIGVGGALFAICVCWGHGRHRWRALTYRLGERGRWPARCRVFRNTVPR